MSYKFNNKESMVYTWLNNNNTELWNEERELTPKNNCNNKRNQPSSLISNLSSIFMMTISYYNLTKQEALDTIGYFLYEYSDIVHSQLLDCLIYHKFLYKPFKEAKYYTIDYNKSIQGIFIPLTKCYSPSCQLNHITCYSPLCPNRRISSLLHVVNYSNASTTHEEDASLRRNSNKQENETKDWIESIPQHIRNSTNRKELKRQAGIAELVLTEQNYCQDLDILHRIYAIPLLESPDIINNPSRRQQFYHNVFGNYLDITHLHHSFYNQLVSSNRQSSFFVGRVGTIIMQHVTNLIEPYIQYASNHTKAIYCMTIEHKSNAQFAKFLAAKDTLKCTRRLGLRHYLTSPTLWIGKLKLMVEAILKNTIDDADQLSLKASLAILHDTLCRMNTSAKLSPQDFRFEELSTSIYTMDMQLLPIPENSVLLNEKEIWLARSARPLQPSLCHVFLFSHALILTHPRVTNGRTEYIVLYGSPIPIQFISLSNSSKTNSMIRRLSFASTSMVSTPMHLISNLRRQKSMNSEASSSNSTNSSSNYSSTTAPAGETTTTTTTNKLNRSNTTIHVAPNAIRSSVKRSTTTITQPSIIIPKNRITLPPFQIKTRLSKLRNRWSTSISAPVSPTTTTTNNNSIMSRRDSAPALLLTPHNTNNSNTTEIQQRRRTLNISHMAYPENAFKLEFLSRSDRLIWETMIKDVILDTEKLNHCFKVRTVSHGLILPSLSKSTLHGVGKIRCSYAFVYSSGKYSKHMVALGTQSGVWLGPRDSSSSARPFQLVLPNQDVHQLSVIHDKLIVMRQEDKHHLLVGYSLKSIINNEQNLDWCIVKRSSVLCFTIGKVRNQSIIVYLTKKLSSTWLVIIIPNNENTTTTTHATTKNHWFKKYKMEYKVTIKDATDIQIIQDSVLVRSDRYGIERIDILAIDYKEGNNWTFTSSNVGLLSYSNRYFICDSQYVYSISLFDQQQNNSKGLMRLKFESQVNSVAMIYPYIIAYSSSVIEIRNIETTELVQVIKGNGIQFIAITNDITQPLFYTMLNDDRVSISLYQLQLSLCNNNNK